MKPEQLIEIMNIRTSWKWSIVENKIDNKKFQIKALKIVDLKAELFITKKFDVSYEVLQEFPEIIIDSLTNRIREAEGK